MLMIVLAILITIYLYQTYRRTQVKDFQYLFLIFATLVLNTPLFLIRHRVEPNKFLFIANITAFNLVYFFGLLHFLNVKFDEIPRRIALPVLMVEVLFSLGYLLTSLVVIPNEGSQLGIPIYVRDTVAGLVAPALKIGSVYVVGDGIFFLENLLRTLIVGFGIFVYSSVSPGVESDSSKKAKRLWVLTTILWLIAPLGNVVGYLFNIKILVNIVFTLLGGVFSVLFMGFTIYRYPHSLILTKQQILQARELYLIIEAKQFNYSSTPMKKIQNYLENLPEELINELKTQ